MPADERRMRHQAGVEIVRHNNVEKWLERQLADVDAVMRREAPPPVGRLIDVTRPEGVTRGVDPSVYFS